MYTKKLKIKNTLLNNNGISLIELLVALLITGIITSAMLGFYMTVHQQSISQEEVSELQNLCRASIYDIQKEARMAGYRIGSHPAVEIYGDMLAIYYNRNNPVDTILYYLYEYDEMEYSKLANLPSGTRVYYLMKQINSDSASIYADFVTDISYEMKAKDAIEISITAIASRPDETFTINNGYRMYTLTDCANLRNKSFQ